MGASYLSVVGVLVELLVERQLEQLERGHGAGAFVGDGAHDLEVGHDLRLGEDVVELVPHLCMC